MYEAPKKRRRGRVKSVSRHEAEANAAAENEKWEHEHGLKVADIYAFTGMHHIFTHHSKAVTRVAFAHSEKGILAMASVDGIISIGYLFDSDPNRSLKILRDHISAVTDISWAYSNAWLASCSLDATLRVWDPSTSSCSHSFDLGAPALCCAFVPSSDHLVLCGDKSGTLHLADSKLGRVVAHIKLASAVTAIGYRETNDTTIAFVGCQTGDLYWIELHGSGSLVQTSHVKLGNTPITSLLFRSQLTGSWNMPSLLVSQIRSPTRLYSLEPNGSGSEKPEIYAEFPPAPKKSFVRSTMCPLVPSRNNVCLVAGSENGIVYIYGVRPPFKQQATHNLQVGWMVNQFAGHAGVIYDVQWNFDESLLVSADQDGMVIVWKRVSVKSPTANFAAAPAQTLPKASQVTSPGAPKKRPPSIYAGSPSRRDLVENPLLAQPSTPSRPSTTRPAANSPAPAAGSAAPRSRALPPSKLSTVSTPRTVVTSVIPPASVGDSGASKQQADADDGIL